MSIDLIPAGAMFVGTIVGVMLFIEAGYRLGRRAHRLSKEEKESPVSAMAGAILSLVAFMLAFTFGIVYDRYDARKGLVCEEANAIRTAWQRAEFLPEADRTEARSLLRQYLEARLDVAQKRGLDPAQVQATISAADRTQSQLWQMAVTRARKDMNSDVAALYIESLNNVASIHALRVAVGVQARMPSGIWLGLFSITILGMMAVGYQMGIAGSKRTLAEPILAVSFAIAIELIASLDRPHSPFITVPHQPLIDLRTLMTP